MSMCENPTAHITKTPRRAANTAAARVSDLGRVSERVACLEPMTCACMIVSLAGVIANTVYLMRPVLRQSRNCRVACLVDRKRIKKTGWGGICAMSCEYRFRAPRALTPFLCLACASLIFGCSDLKKAIGLERSTPDEFAVESRAPLTMPPDFHLRPPQPGAARPQEKSADQQARQAIEQAGPGEPGKQAPDFRLRRAEDGLPDIGARSGQAPDPNAVVGEQSLSSKLLDYQPSNGAQPAPVEKRETNPLKGVY